MDKHRELLKPSDAVLLAAVAAVPFIVLGGVAIGIDVISSDATAAWVQAIGSLLAVAIAIYVPYNLHMKDLKRQREAEIAHAHVVAASVALMLTPAISAVKAFVREANAVDINRGVISPRIWLQRFNMLVKPTDQQVLLLEPGSREMALAIARGFNRIEQLRQVTLALLSDGESKQATLQFIRIIPLAQIAIDQLTTAAGLMDQFVTSIEGPEVTGPAGQENT